MPTDPILKTERTVVERVALSDASFFFKLMNSPGWRRFIGDRGLADVEAARGVVCDAYLKVYAEHGFGYYVIRDTNDRAPMGIAGFLKKPTLSNPDFGFAMLPEYQGQGLAGEACAAILDFGIRTFGFPALDAVTQPDNLKSIRLLEQLDFRAAGRLESETEGDALLLYRWTPRHKRHTDRSS